MCMPAHSAKKKKRKNESQEPLHQQIKYSARIASAATTRPAYTCERTIEHKRFCRAFFPCCLLPILLLPSILSFRSVSNIYVFVSKSWKKAKKYFSSLFFFLFVGRECQSVSDRRRLLRIHSIQPTFSNIQRNKNGFARNAYVQPILCQSIENR